jgi:hypothetical protein
MAAVTNLIGALAGHAVAKTVSSGLVERIMWAWVLTLPAAAARWPMPCQPRSKRFQPVVLGFFALHPLPPELKQARHELSGSWVRQSDTGPRGKS